MTKFSLEQIRDFWTEQAKQHGKSFAASWSDRPVMEMEVRQILDFLKDGDDVLDVGCANGWSTVQFASQRAISICGVDYIPEMVAEAQERLRDATNELPNVRFAVGNILELADPAETYDKVITIRVLINLRSWENQLQGIRECARVLRRGGLFLLSEATLQGWNRLNAFRAEWGLPPIPMPPFNEYLDQDRLTSAIAPHLELVKVVDFASTYYVGTRVLKPLLASVASGVNVSDPNMEWNRFFSLLPPAGDYGTQKLFVFRKP